MGRGIGVRTTNNIEVYPVRTNNKQQTTNNNAITYSSYYW